MTLPDIVQWVSDWWEASDCTLARGPSTVWITGQQGLASLAIPLLAGSDQVLAGLPWYREPERLKDLRRRLYPKHHWTYLPTETVGYIPDDPIRRALLGNLGRQHLFWDETGSFWVVDFTEGALLQMGYAI